MSPERKYTLFILTDIFIWEIPRKMKLHLNTGFKEMWHRIVNFLGPALLLPKNLSGKKVQVPVAALILTLACS